jgi:hypothetical protein
MSKNRPPVVLCDVHPPKKAGDAEIWSFWCPYCRKVHTHGGGKDGEVGGGHRVAHCWKQDSPYWVTGYILKRKERAA